MSEQKTEVATGAKVDESKTITVNVLTLTNRSTPIELKLGETIRDFKIHFQDKDGVPPDQQKLSFGQTNLDDDTQKIADAKLTDGCTVLLTMQLRPAPAKDVTVTLKDAASGKEFVTVLKTTTDIRTVREIYTQNKEMPQYQDMVFKIGTTLTAESDSFTLDRFCPWNDRRVTILVKASRFALDHPYVAPATAPAAPAVPTTTPAVTAAPAAASAASTGTSGGCCVII